MKGILPIPRDKPTLFILNKFGGASGVTKLLVNRPFGDELGAVPDRFVQALVVIGDPQGLTISVQQGYGMIAIGSRSLIGRPLPGIDVDFLYPLRVL